MDLHAVVRHYRRRHQARAAAELDSFRSETTVAAAVRRAALAVDNGGHRYPHQRRRVQSALELGAERLARVLDAIEAASSFNQLFAVVKRAVENVSDLGELYIYDTALRIGARKATLPKRVYLHSGTREGAKALGLDVKNQIGFFKSELPEPLRALEPHELEDVLCIYKRYFSGEVADLDANESCWIDVEEDELSGCS